MNKDLLLTIADMIETKPTHFNMDTFIAGPEGGYNYETRSYDKLSIQEWFDFDDVDEDYGKCDTHACIGGWANILTGGFSVADHEDRAAKELDLDFDTAHELFYPNSQTIWGKFARQFGWTDVDVDADWANIPAEMAVELLRALANGDIEFDV